MDYSLINGHQTQASPCQGNYADASKTGYLQPPPTTINNLSLEERHELIRQYGYQSSSYFSLQQGVEHIGIAGVGFIAFYIQRFFRHHIQYCFY